MTLDDAIAALRELNEEVPRPLRLPTEAEVAAAERDIGVPFHPDLRRYLLRASDVVLGALEPVTLTRPDAHTHLPRVAADAWAAGVPRDHVPVCEDNADFYCVAPDGRVVFLSHNGPSSDAWPDLAAWIEDVWIGESD